MKPTVTNTNAMEDCDKTCKVTNLTVLLAHSGRQTLNYLLGNYSLFFFFIVSNIWPGDYFCPTKPQLDISYNYVFP